MSYGSRRKFKERIKISTGRKVRGVELTVFSGKSKDCFRFRWPGDNADQIMKPNLKIFIEE
jgi:hypothetical protein